MGKYKQWLQHQQTGQQLRDKLAELEVERKGVLDLSSGGLEQITPQDDNPILMALQLMYRQASVPDQNEPILMPQAAPVPVESEEIQQAEYQEPQVAETSGTATFDQAADTFETIDHILQAFPSTETPQVPVENQSAQPVFDAATMQPDQNENKNVPWWIKGDLPNGNTDTQMGDLGRTLKSFAAQNPAPQENEMGASSQVQNNGFEQTNS